MKLGLASSGGVFLDEIFLDGFVVLGLSFCESLRSRIGFESLEGGFDILLDLCVVLGALFGLTSGLFGGFNNRHFVPI